ncbi:Auxin-induced protein 5NG4 [Glycine soja]|uniref:Auxin-induced protein 5NG4 n=1 Tax=Glycine soja TaxID=3848 RepID=A0A0B2S2U6_GLYSO|nr:Auxin-induced protein 5NG4 [Glycine soja]
MEQKRCSFVTIYRDFKPYLLMVLVQVGLSILYLITKASFNHGMSPIVAVVVMLPFAYFLERKARPHLTFSLFVQIFVLSLLGSSLTLNIHFASLKYTNPTFLVAMLNTIPTLTFILAVALSIIGAFAVIIGLYLLLWGKSEQKVSKCRNEDPECKSTTLAGK